MIVVLWVTLLSGPFDGESYGIPYFSQQACLDAKRTVSNTLDYDHNMTCEAL
jgi:hypothetical protein